MQEYVSEAIVLHAEPNGDLDSRFSLFTKHFGKLKGKAKSVRKITSKLAGHLQPGNVIHARLVEKSGLQIVDALKHDSLKVSLHDLYFLDQLLAEAAPEPEIWNALTNASFSWKHVLGALGWDPQHSECVLCAAHSPAVFRIKTQEFFCENCALKVSADEVISI